MSDDFLAIEEWAAGLLAQLRPAERRRVNRAVALELRRNESQRIALQRQPDGSPFAPRHAPKNLRGKKGKIRRAMFAKLRTARHIRIDATDTDAVVGYTGRAARIAIIHQEGRTDRPGPGQSPVRYPRRRLIGFTRKSRERVLETLAQHLAGRKL